MTKPTRIQGSPALVLLFDTERGAFVDPDTRWHLDGLPALPAAGDVVEFDGPGRQRFHVERRVFRAQYEAAPQNDPPTDPEGLVPWRSPDAPEGFGVVLLGRTESNSHALYEPA